MKEIFSKDFIDIFEQTVNIFKQTINIAMQQKHVEQIKQSIRRDRDRSSGKEFERPEDQGDREKKKRNAGFRMSHLAKRDFF